MIEIQKILVVAPAWVGDMVMAQVLFRLLKQSRPEVIIDVLAPPSTLPLVEFMPEVSAGIAAPFGHGELKLWQRYRLAKRLRKAGYGQAIVLPNSFKSALIPWWAGIKKRTGFKGECRYGLLNDARELDKQKLPLMIQRFATLSDSLPNRLPWPQLKISEQIKKPEQFILALCPGAAYGPAKRWPANYFAKVAQAALTKNMQVWIFGGPGDVGVAQQITALAPECNNLAGKTSLVEAVHMMSLVDRVITNDSGLMHVAAALGKPLTAIYGSSSPDFTPPLSGDVKVLSKKLDCSPCFKRECPLGHMNCLVMLEPEEVIATL